MRIWTFAFLFSLLFCGRQAFAQLACEQVFNSSNSFPSEKLSDVPGLSEEINSLLSDPYIPMTTKNILRRALSENLTVIEVTSEIKEFYEIKGTAFVLTTQRRRDQRGYTLQKTQSWRSACRDAKQSILRSLKLWQNSAKKNGHHEKATELQERQIDLQNQFDYIVAIESLNEPGQNQDQVGQVIHELAHIRFFRFLSENLNLLKSRLPPSLIWEENGTTFIDRDFELYLNERYAFSEQMKFLNATANRQTPNERRPYDKEIAEVLAQSLLGSQSAYRIDRPLVRSLSKFTISEILLGIPFRASLTGPE